MYWKLLLIATNKIAKIQIPLNTNSYKIFLLSKKSVVSMIQWCSSCGGAGSFWLVQLDWARCIICDNAILLFERTTSYIIFSFSCNIVSINWRPLAFGELISFVICIREKRKLLRNRIDGLWLNKRKLYHWANISHVIWYCNMQLILFFKFFVNIIN